MYKKISELISIHKNIVIHRHSNPDGDALGSQFGLAELIKLNFKNKNVFIVGDKNEFINNSIKNIFVDDFINPKIKDYENALTIVVDTANTERIEGQNYSNGKTIVKIDHHVTSDNYGDFEIVENTISSTCEIITNIAIELNWSINKKASEYLLTGIITDTGRFMFNSVKEGTFKVSQHLVENGAKMSKIVNKLNDRDLAFIRLQAKVQSDFEYKNGVSWYIMPKNLHTKFNVPYSSASSMVFALMSFREAEYAVFASFDEENNIWKGSLRSKKKPINNIAELFNGGGHEMASGFKFDKKKEFKKVVKHLRKLAKK